MPNRPYDACRIYGSLILNKVAGNFHITAGKSLSLPRGHIHISAFMTEQDYNFTHRINRLNFGEPSPGIIHPLEGDEKMTDNSELKTKNKSLLVFVVHLFFVQMFSFSFILSIADMMLYQYFIEVVPTNVKTFLTTTNTFQYSVKELSRPIDHHKGSHGMPGIFFKYDMSALKVTIRQERDNFTTFLARLCATIGGIYVCSGKQIPFQLILIFSTVPTCNIF